ncbi:MAG: PD-(D/E)XK nuclease family protein, partial [Granulosicoccaceae bacterium]
TDTLRHAYGDADNGKPVISEHLDRESRLVYTLWQAWREQLRQQGCVDNHDDYRDKLVQSLHDTQPWRFWLVGIDHFIPAENDWLQHMLTRQQASLIVQGNGHGCPDSHPDAVADALLANLQLSPCRQAHDTPPASRFIDSVYDNRLNDFAQRADVFAQHCPVSPVQERLGVLHAESEEQQALAVELQVRLWLQQGKQQIGIVTQNRRLARRIRALLERANIVLHDSAGWALSTTSAAAALERWLECIELDFDYIPLLDLLKSAFIDPAVDTDDLRQLVYRFEQDIIVNEAVTSNLSRYRQQLESRRKRLQLNWPDDVYNQIAALLDVLGHAAAPLRRFEQQRRHDASAWLEALLESLRRLGMLTRFEKDAAGNRIVEEIGQLLSAAQRYPLLMSHNELRNWLARCLEQYTFKPSSPAQAVQLLDLSQTRLMRFDALVIAGADRAHLPGAPAVEPFFNETVRLSLGLPGYEQDVNRRFHAFRCLLDTADEILLTTHRINMNGDPVLDSPWLEALIRFHARAYGNDLENAALHAKLASSTAVIRDTRSDLPMPGQQPAPEVAPPLRAERISASDYQRLVDCPYRYYASRCLGLRAPDEISEVLGKNEFGERIHLCLQAFHAPVDWLPAPFAQVVTMANRSEAIAHLEKISRAVFARDIDSHFEHRDWYRQWQQTIPAYINWQIKRATGWQVYITEEKRSNDIQGIPLPLYGRLDRIDKQAEQLAIIDYKTGSTASKQDVEQGESVQLPFYALLYGDQVCSVEYLAIDTREHTVKSKVVLGADELDSLVSAHHARLAALADTLQQGHPMPAWPGKACQYCEMDGLCRYEDWQETLGDSA